MLDAQLLDAVQSSDVQSVQSALTAGANPNAQGFTKSALHWAVHHGSFECVDVLLKAGASVHTLTPLGETALHEVARYSAVHQDASSIARAGQIAQLLLNHGVDPLRSSKMDPLNGNGHKTAAHTLAGARSGALALEWLLQNTPDLVHAVDERGNTPLAIAVLEGRSANVDVLLHAKSDPYAQNFKGETVMALAQCMNPSLVDRMVESLEKHERALLLANTGRTSMTPPRPKARL